MIVLIPAYEPDQRLVQLVEALCAAAPDVGIVVVDDGSGPRHREVFDAVRARGATVIGHPVNHGKGFALRSGFRYLAQMRPDQDVVSADCDGQHTAVDILRVAARVQASGTMVLGAREFCGAVPARSLLGNRVTRALVGAVMHCRLQDTQTGLRGYPSGMLAWLQTVPGDRFEYELTVLLSAARAGLPVEELPIATVYLDDNASSHFRPVIDSLRVLRPLLTFSASSFAAFGIDTFALMVLTRLTGTLWVSVLAARAISSTVNFLVNRRWVFGSRARHWGLEALRYWALVAVLLTANYALLATMTEAGLALLPAKLVTEAVLFVASYEVQHRFVFAAPRWAATGAPEAPRPADLSRFSPHPQPDRTAR